MVCVYAAERKIICITHTLTVKFGTRAQSHNYGALSKDQSLNSVVMINLTNSLTIIPSQSVACRSVGSAEGAKAPGIHIRKVSTQGVK